MVKSRKSNFQYCQGSTLVLSKEYCSTFRGVLQYFYGSTGTRGNCSSFKYRMSCLDTLSLYIFLQCEDKFQSSLRHVLGEDGSAMEQYGVLHDGQSQTCTS